MAAFQPEALVIGAGPGGASATLWCRSFGLRVELIEAEARLGGQLHHIHQPIGNYAGAPLVGAELARRMEGQLQGPGFATRLSARVVELKLEPPAVQLAGGPLIETEAVIVATGIRRRELGVPGEREFLGRGVFLSATRDRERVAGQPVVVVGGGDAACENALLLAQVGCPVALVVRGSELSARREFRERIRSEPRIELLLETRVEEIHGSDHVTGVVVDGACGARRREAAGVFVKVGAIPNTEWCGSGLRRDGRGYLMVDETLRTSHARVWAVGDVIHPTLPSIAHAVGGGAKAAAELYRALRG